MEYHKVEHFITLAAHGSGMILRKSMEGLYMNNKFDIIIII